MSEDDGRLVRIENAIYGIQRVIVVGFWIGALVYTHQFVDTTFDADPLMFLYQHALIFAFATGAAYIAARTMGLRLVSSN